MMEYVIDPKARIARDLEEARRRTTDLLAPVDDLRLMAQHNRLMSPLVWDYAHVGVYEELWLVNQLSSTPPVNEGWLHLYDAFENPRATRGELPLMDRRQVEEYRDEVRGRVLEILDKADLASDNPLLQDGYVYEMVIEHEHQHDETVLQALQLLPGGYCPPLPAAPSGRLVTLDMVTVPAGRYPVGSDCHTPWDNEGPAHEVELKAYRIDRFPVTNGQFREFMAEGGYSRRELWSESGWEWLQNSRATAPKYWRFEQGEWLTDRFGHIVPVEWDRPVVHVCYHEAEGYARWAGKRLPTEFEWEVAASWNPLASRARLYPWGDELPSPDRANLDQWLYGPAPIGAYPGGVSALGCEQMVGDVWEWTSSDFHAYPGFRPFPYAEYSEVFFGPDHKVLRGASWAARPSVGRVTFRNWDYPIRRQIFAGFRCAMDLGA
ncbi:MAG: ergothioneine biosynthesis protein EgtB [Chloroflexota bacterium]|nr:ergothioneine biosynthesis protein EgtB [Chloroflexota bacterium]